MNRTFPFVLALLMVVGLLTACESSSDNPCLDAGFSKSDCAAGEKELQKMKD